MSRAKSAPERSRGGQRPPASRKKAANPRAFWVVAAALLVLGALIWLVWPSRYTRVRNLESQGSAVIAFGDSITAGYGAGSGEDYPTQLSNRLDTPVVNAGVSGDTTESALARMESDVLSRDPRIVIVGLGGNDFLRSVPISTTEANLRSIVRQSQSAGAMVVLLGFRFPSLGSNYEEMYERVAEQEKALLVPGVLAGILTDPSLKSDDIHPNGRGYELIAERVAGPVAKLIRKADDARD